MVFVVSLHRQALISCGTKCYFSKLGYQLSLVQCFWKKLKSIHFQFFFSFLVPKISYFFKNGSKTLQIYRQHYLEKFYRHILSKYRQISKTWGGGSLHPPPLFPLFGTPLILNGLFPRKLCCFVPSVESEISVFHKLKCFLLFFW